MLEHFANTKWDDDCKISTQQQAIKQLEAGQILFFPDLAFHLSEEEKVFLNEDYADPHSKNICYHPEQHKLWGVQRLTDKQRLKLKSMLDRFSHYAFRLVRQILPLYTDHLIIARTSFRPVQISNRITSYRKDDKRLHVDAFPSAPNQGKRILRVFSNVNPSEDRIWRVGETFTKVAEQFLPRIRKPIVGTSSLLRLLRITKSYRTPYDHYMLNIHDAMKIDDHYQKHAEQQTLCFPPNSSWIVETDHVSHAAMQGRHVLEQTFYLPVSAMQDPSQSPLRVLEKQLKQKLVY